MSEKLPRKLPAKQIAILFGVSEQRISQLKRQGKLNPDSANLYDVQEAMQMRGFQMSEHGVRVVAQQYSNGTGAIAPAKVVALTNSIELSAEDQEVLGVDMTQTRSSPNSVVAAQSRISELREAKLRADLDRAQTRLMRERGELVERAAVQSSFIAAGQLIANNLQNLPAEIAAIFADPDKKAEVRLKVQTRIDQMQYALFSALKGYGDDETTGPPV